MTGRKNCALQEPLVVPYKVLGKFPKALYGTTGGTCSARFFPSFHDSSISVKMFVVADRTFIVVGSKHMKTICYLSRFVNSSVK